ncbi:MAG: isoprenylcysteine carboxylmethyltransferase family protein [Bacteroidetes bacterium]|nr:isoprenylcysteine carboxylmethyltransferase family protein [Bacteroidota bacterium]
MKQPSFFKHLRDIILLPFTVTVLIPWFILDDRQHLFPVNGFIRFTGFLFLVVGLFLFSLTIFLFVTIGKGTLAPWTPTQKLVIRGPYQYCRNPMITAVLFILSGETLILNSCNLFIWVILFFIINTLYFIFKEEPGLQKRFGDEYRKYKENVPRWIPRVKPYREKK